MTTTVGRKGLDLFNSLLLGMGACSLLGYLLGWREAGRHQVTRDASGLPSGLYFCRMQAREFSAVQKMMLVK